MRYQQTAAMAQPRAQTFVQPKPEHTYSIVVYPTGEGRSDPLAPSHCLHALRSHCRASGSPFATRSKLVQHFGRGAGVRVQPLQVAAQCMPH